MSGSQSAFYGIYTERKLQAIEAYLKSFLSALSAQNFKTYYIDAFAGSGTIPTNLGGTLFDDMEDAQKLVEGSALRALRLDRKFDRYIFIEKDRRKLRELEEQIRLNYDEEPSVDFILGDAGCVNRTGIAGDSNS